MQLVQKNAGSRICCAAYTAQRKIQWHSSPTFENRLLGLLHYAQTTIIKLAGGL